MGVVIRSGTLNDVRALVRMHAECSPASVERRYMSPMPVLSSRFASRLLCPVGGFSKVAEQDHQMVGIATVAPDVDDDTARTAEVGELVVDRFQRQGIGTTLLAAAARDASTRGFTALLLSVHPDNRAVIPMVNAAGLRARVNTRDGLTRVAIPLAAARRDAAVHST
jgi:ribosomal protein S18 acetylase RimI-like enzyme